MKDLTGQRFGRLTVMNYTGTYLSPKGSKKAKWLCKCDCGKEIIVIGNNLRKGKTKSCGCLQREITINRSTIHNMSKSRIFHIWFAIKRRCTEKNYRAYNHYGGRGIKICDEWKNDFTTFYNWAIVNGYNDKLTIERIDVNGNYEPNNCKWATRIEQANNKRTNKHITYKEQTRTLKEWCNLLQLPYGTILYRINKRHDTPKQAFETKIGAAI